MPNWTTNQLIIEGDADQIKELLNFIKGDDEAIDFNKIIPMPEILKNTASGACTIDGKQVNSWYEDASIADWADRSKTQRLFTDEETAELEKTGYTSWYDWACDKWGTKWNACESSIECEYALSFVVPHRSNRPGYMAGSQEMHESLHGAVCSTDSTECNG